MIIVIVGPTDIGKTALSLKLAEHYDTEIISGDSVQLYKGLDIGSAKIKPHETRGIVHHMIDLFNPDEDCTVAVYQKLVRDKIKYLKAKGKLPIIVGGTGFYIKSVLHDFNFAGKRKDEFNQQHEDKDNETLHARLMKYDPESAKAIHPNNRVRLLQALYRAEIGQPISSEKSGNKKIYDYLILALTCNRQILYDRINRRVEQMFEEGLVDEVRDLYDRGIRSNSVSAIGYKELYRVFNNEITLDEAKQLIQKNTRNYAKKQYTYLKNQFDITWIEVDFDHPEKTFDEAVMRIENTLKQP